MSASVGESHRKDHTRCESEHGSQALQGPWYYAGSLGGESVVAGIEIKTLAVRPWAFFGFAPRPAALCGGWRCSTALPCPGIQVYQLTG